MKITLKNMKHSALASQETNFFTADVYVDGVKAGSVSNDGRGGSDNMWPRTLEERINAYAKTLPQIEFGVGDGTVRKLDQDAETIIGELVEYEIASKHVRRLLKTKLVFVNDKMEMRTTGALKPEVLGHLATMPLADLQVKFAGLRIVLNALPFEAAVAVYRNPRKAVAEALKGVKGSVEML